MVRIIFGNENAEADSLLRSCYVLCGTKETYPILVGRWGTGKTATLINFNWNLEDALVSINKSYRRMWHLDERSIDVNSLVSIGNRFRGDEASITKAYESIWKVEITRVMLRQLHVLRPIYGEQKGAHWDTIQRAGNWIRIEQPLWMQLNDAEDFIFNQKVIPSSNIGEFTVGNLFSNSTRDDINLCLEDISSTKACTEENIQPVVAIEPIDTPTSALENTRADYLPSGFAQPLVNALLNVYRDEFEENETTNQRIIVQLSIPWHRYLGGELAFPQKLKQYRYKFLWTPECLKGFIHKRIMWEFSRIGPHLKRKNADDGWGALFEDRVYWDKEKKIKENSFAFVLRHTHHRPRDLQRMAKAIVKLQAAKWKISEDDVLRGHKGNIPAATIKSAVVEEGREAGKERMTEAERKFLKIRNIVSVLYNMPNPFPVGQFYQRFHDNPPVIGLSAEEGKQILWDSGIIGVVIYADGGDAIQSVNDHCGEETRSKEHLSESAHSKSKNIRDSVARFFLFEYNWSGNISEIINWCETQKGNGIKADLVVHPIMSNLDILNMRQTQDFPIGV